MNKNREPVLATGLTRKQKVASAVGLAATIAAGTFASVELLDKPQKKAPIHQPTELVSTPNGSEVPEGFQAPVGVKISPHPDRPGESIIEYGTSPDGQTLPSRVIPTPTTTTSVK